jgi:hypothetical protein
LNLRALLHGVLIFLLNVRIIEPFGRHVTLGFDDGTITTFQESEA